jgi:hypothetical protein
MWTVNADELNAAVLHIHIFLVSTRNYYLTYHLSEIVNLQNGYIYSV